MSLHIDELNSRREKAMLWYKYYFYDPSGLNRAAISSCTWNTVLTQCVPVRRLSADLERADSDPKSIDMALVCFVMNENEFPTSLEKRVHRQLNGQAVENDPHSKGSNQWGIDLYNELQWLNDKDKQHDFVLLRGYVRPLGTRRRRPIGWKQVPDSSSDEEDAAPRPKQVRGKAQGSSSISVALDLPASKSEDDGERNDPSEDSSEEHDDDGTNDTYFPPLTRPRIPRTARALSQREYLHSTRSAIANKLSSARDTEKQQQQDHPAHRQVARQTGASNRRGDIGRGTASSGSRSFEDAYDEATQDRPMTNREDFPRWHTAKRMRGLRDDSQGPDRIAAKRPRVCSGPSSLPIHPSRLPGTLGPSEAPTQQPDEPASTSSNQTNFNGRDHGTDKNGLVDRFKDHMLRLRGNKNSQQGLNGEQLTVHLARGGTHRADTSVNDEITGDDVIHDDEQRESSTERYTWGGQYVTSEETKPVSEKVLDERLSTHMRDLEVQIQLSLDSMEDNLISSMTRTLGDIRSGVTGTSVLKPGNKLPNGVVVWDARLLTAAYDPEDFIDFFSLVGKEHWHEDNRAWRSQEKYFTELALAHPCGPKSLAGLARSWKLTDLEVDLEGDIPVVLAQKVYIRAVAGTFEKDQMEAFFRSINEG